MVTSVPYQLRGSEKAKERDDWERERAAARRRTTWPHPVGTVTASEDSLVGERFEVEVGPVAHGGHFVARVATGLDERQMVIFVRHALPGEQVTVEVTEDSGRFLRGDAVHVSVPSPHRVRAPCPLAHPGGCGGCDFQHVELAEQRRLKASVVEEQLSRLAGLEREVRGRAGARRPGRAVLAHADAVRPPARWRQGPAQAPFP